MQKKNFSSIAKDDIKEEIEEIKDEIKDGIEEIKDEIKEEAIKIIESAENHSKYFWFFPIYILGYIFVERIYSPSAYHVMHCALDDMVPFCEYFVIPYFLWHILIVAVSVYTFRKDSARFEKLLRFFISCCIILLPIFILFPSCQLLRPDIFPRENLFTDIVRLTYQIDTNTNVCPSMHVIGCVGMLFTCWNMEKLDTLKGHIIQLLIFVSICLSTVFLKQHSFIDVLAAIPVSVIGWWMSYGDAEKFRKHEFKKIASLIFERGKIFTIPNLMSLFRLCLIPVIIIEYTKTGNQYIVVLLITISAITDVLDGMVARGFNMTSSLGKILDPIADKLTQLALIYILIAKYPALWYLFILILVKEGIQAVFGYLMIQKNMVVHSSQWFGKLSTVLLYAAIIVLMLFNDLPSDFIFIANVLCIAAHMLALVLYTRFYLFELYPNTMYIIRDYVLRGAGFVLWAIAVAAILINYDKLSYEFIAENAPQNMLDAAIIMLLLFAAKSLTVVFSSTVLFAASAVIFPTWTALIVNFLGILVMATLPYFIGKTGGEDELKRLCAKHPRLCILHGKKIHNNFLFVIALRLNFAINYDIGSMYLGSRKIPYSSYYLGSVIGMLPNMLLSTFVGININTGDYTLAIIMYSIIIIFTALSFFLLNKELH